MSIKSKLSLSFVFSFNYCRTVIFFHFLFGTLILDNSFSDLRKILLADFEKIVSVTASYFVFLLIILEPEFAVKLQAVCFVWVLTSCEQNLRKPKF